MRAKTEKNPRTSLLTGRNGKDTERDIKAKKMTLRLAIHARLSVASQEQTTGLARVVERVSITTITGRDLALKDVRAGDSLRGKHQKRR